MKSLQSLSYKTLFIIFFLSLAGIVFFLKIGGKTTKVSAAWWDESWHYRKSISVTNSSGTNLTDFQVSISIGTSQLIADGKMQTDCDDIRITDINGNLLPYWIETTGTNKCNQTADTRVWVKANSIPTSGSTVYIYYGNPSANSQSSGQNTFIYFKDNFQTSDVDWNWTNGGVENGWAKTWSTGADNPGSTMTWIKNIINITGQEVVAEFTVKATKSGSTGHDTTNVLFNPTRTTTLYNNTNSSTIANGSGNSIITFGDYGGWYGKVGFDASTGQASNISNDTSYPLYKFNTDGWVRHVHKLTNSSLLLSGYSLGGLDTNNNSWAYTEKTVTSGYTKPNSIILAIGEQFNESIWMSEVFVRKYVSTQPTTSNQSEEIGTGPIAYWKFDEGVGTTAYDSAGSNNGTFGTGSSAPTWVSEDQCISGKCLSFDGVGDYIDSNFKYPNKNADYEVSASAWVKLTSSTGYRFIIGGINGGRADLLVNNSNLAECRAFDSSDHIATGTTNINDGKWHYISCVSSRKTSNFTKLYVDGKLESSINYSSTVGYNENIKISAGASAGKIPFTGLIDEVKIYPYARTADQIKLDYNSHGSLSGSSANLGVQSNTAPSLKSSLVAYYKFDENSGTIAHDSSGNNLNGTFGTGSSAPTWTQGKNKQALNFNGTTNYVSTPYIPNISSNQLTISTWIKPNSIAGVQDISNQNQWDGGPWTGWRFQLTNGNITFKLGDGTSTPYLYSAGTISANTWQHIVGVWDGSYIYIYVNGKEVGKSAKSFTYSGNTSTHFIGKYPGTAYFFNGLIDEVKVYNTALTAEEIKQDYNQGSAISFGSTIQNIGGTTTSLDYCIPGDASTCSAPVAEWNFEENTGTTVKDTSGNGNNGTISSANWSSGINNKGSSLNVTGNVIVPDSNSLRPGNNITVSSWFNLTDLSVTNTLLSKRSSNDNYWIDIRQNGTQICAGGYTSEAAGCYDCFTIPTILTNKWYNIAFTYDRQKMITYLNGKEVSNVSKTCSLNSDSSNLYLGSRTGSSIISGKIDNIKIYNYIRTPAQIAYDYNKGAPVGWWKMDECQGSTINDSSGNNNFGTLSIGQSGTQNSIGTCQIGTSAAWTNGASGHINSSLNFDGTDDYVTVTNNSAFNLTDNLSISSWIKINSLNRNHGIVGKTASIWGDVTYSTRVDADNKYSFVTYGTSQDDLTGGTADLNWHHVVFWFSKPTKRIYVDGIKIAENTWNQSIRTNSQNLSLGAYTWGNGLNYLLNGQLDDVRIYNYALTPEQIKQVYNGGSVSFN